MRTAALSPDGPRRIRFAASSPARRAAGRSAAALFAAAAGGGAFGSAEAYRLYDRGAADSVVTSAEAISWAPEVWGPGQELEWFPESQPEWEAAFGDADREGSVTSVIGRALAVWSSIPGADIRWVEAATAAPFAGRWNRDASNRVFFSAAGDEGAGVWFSRSEARQVWEISECDVALPSWLAEGDWDPEFLESLATAALTEAFGACLGLGPSAEPPTSASVRVEEPETDDFASRISGFWNSPRVDRPLWNSRFDWAVGAALLRPRAGWLETVGAISGALEAEGEPLPYAHVWAFRIGEGVLTDPVGAFSNRAGEFLIEGLPPGRYLLWAHPIDADFHRLLGAGGRTDVSDVLRMLPVRVTAGEAADGIVLTLEPNRAEPLG